MLNPFNRCPYQSQRNVQCRKGVGFLYSVFPFCSHGDSFYHCPYSQYQRKICGYDGIRVHCHLSDNGGFRIPYLLCGRSLILTAKKTGPKPLSAQLLCLGSLILTCSVYPFFFFASFFFSSSYIALVAQYDAELVARNI